MYKKLSLFLFCILITSISLGQDTETIIVDQPNSPIEIENYEASYQEFSHLRNGIRHKVVYKNSGSYNAVAIEFGFVSFNIFNEYLGNTHWIVMGGLNMNETDDGTWVHSPPSGFSFYTGIAYVNKVRFENDEIWEANLEIVKDTLKDIKSDFDSSVLTKENQN